MKKEIVQNLTADLGMGDLRMKLEANQIPIRISHGSNGGVGGMS
jgi:hypothetical protein